jgi:hypothetical protein
MRITDPRKEEGTMPNYFEFEVSLREIKPKIWRRFLIQEGATFMDLHEAIQEACGWWNCHLFVFHTPDGNPIAGIPDDEYGEPDPDAEKVKLASFFGPGGHKHCRYNYDFGDDWNLEIKCLWIPELQDDFKRRLLDGGRAFPKEDCGGVPGYRDCVRVAKGGKDPEDLKKWLGGWHPERFDLGAIRKRFDRKSESSKWHLAKRRAIKSNWEAQFP